MPLGQAPFGSRQTPPDEEPPQDPRARGDRLVSQGRWIFLMGSAVLLAFVAARGMGGGKTGDRAEGGFARPGPCLTDRSCAKGWRCFVLPKDDPFVTEGECAQVCESSLQCPQHYECLKVSVVKGPFVVPEGARGATAETTGVCRACGPKGCTPQ